MAWDGASQSIFHSRRRPPIRLAKPLSLQELPPRSEPSVPSRRVRCCGDAAALLNGHSAELVWGQRDPVPMDPSVNHDTTYDRVACSMGTIPVARRVLMRACGAGVSVALDAGADVRSTRPRLLLRYSQAPLGRDAELEAQAARARKLSHFETLKDA